MGMFDSLYDTEGNEWQTKAFSCNLDRYEAGDKMPASVDDFQVEVFGGPKRISVDSHATVRDGILTKVPDERDESLPLMDYHGYVYDTTAGE